MRYTQYCTMATIRVLEVCQNNFVAISLWVLSIWIPRWSNDKDVNLFDNWAYVDVLLALHWQCWAIDPKTLPTIKAKCYPFSYCKIGPTIILFYLNMGLIIILNWKNSILSCWHVTITKITWFFYLKNKLIHNFFCLFIVFLLIYSSQTKKSFSPTLSYPDHKKKTISTFTPLMSFGSEPSCAYHFISIATKRLSPSPSPSRKRHTSITILLRSTFGQPIFIISSPLLRIRHRNPNTSDMEIHQDPACFDVCFPTGHRR